LALGDLSQALMAVLEEINRYAPPVELANEATHTTALAAPPLSAADPEVLKLQLSEFLWALDSDNPTRVKRAMTVLEQQLPAGALVAIRVRVMGYDFRGAEACTRQLALQYAIDFGD
jgi:hypothetical protein